METLRLFSFNYPFKEKYYALTLRVLFQFIQIASDLEDYLSSLLSEATLFPSLNNDNIFLKGFWEFLKCIIEFGKGYLQTVLFPTSLKVN